MVFQHMQYHKLIKYSLLLSPCFSRPQTCRSSFPNSSQLLFSVILVLKGRYTVFVFLWITYFIKQNFLNPNQFAIDDKI